jgi:hypothetical protein
VAKEPGVVAYLVLSPKGDVLAPAARARTQVSQLPGLGVAPSDVLRYRAQWNGDLIEVALPVAAGDDPRAAVAALTFRPSASGGGGLLLGPLLVLALLLGWLFAISLRRRTLGALTRFNEDLDLLLAGQVPSVADPMGTKPTKDLADLLNHLVARVRAGDATAAGRRAAEAAPRVAPSAPTTARHERAASPARDERATTARRPSAPAPARECRVVASPTFRVTDASPSCSELLGVRPDALIGQHVLDTIPDRAILDAILKCLSKLPAVGEERATVTPESRPFSLAIAVSRAGRDQPIEIAFTVDGDGR